LTDASSAIATRDASTVSSELTVDQLLLQTAKIQEAMKAVMKEGEHYGVIPGTNKPTLYKPGAEKLLVLFRLDPQYEVVEKTEHDGLVSYLIRCVLYHSPSGTRIASGMGEANSHESKYRWNWQEGEKPGSKDEAEQLKAEGKGRWRKVGGQWQWQVKLSNKNPMDLANTLLKMACKRALVAGVLNATAASDIFTQDLEDMDLPTPEPKLNLVSKETLDELTEVLAVCWNINADLWGTAVVLTNASQRFQRKIETINGLSEEEARQIIVGANAWLETNAGEQADENVTEVEEVEQIELLDLQESEYQATDA
jgi:hypothetical protein